LTFYGARPDFTVGARSSYGDAMVKLTKLNGREFVLNSDLIKFIEETPDTIITLRDQEKIIVRETADDVIRRVIDFRRSERLLPE
jgi:flagellar protein FlbD